MMINAFREENNIIDTFRVRASLIKTIGIWENGRLNWLRESGEQLLTEQGLFIKISQPFIHSKLLLTKIAISNHLSYTRKIKLIIMHQHPKVRKEHLSFISPAEDVILHLASDRAYLVNGYGGEGIQQRTIQPNWKVRSEQIWSSAEKGILLYQPMVKGAATSIYTADHTLAGRTTSHSSHWIIESSKEEELIHLNQVLLEKQTSISI
ncbi:hypothetical protein [Mesobacillus harenae]|uniref:hypothetical protein n=1 Tax=Mesobacillus harenae TaxID=2213203 RepID=UPI0015810015|nr:hypothetical protein [Mesobacillus harenae]